MLDLDALCALLGPRCGLVLVDAKANVVDFCGTIEVVTGWKRYEAIGLPASMVVRCFDEEMCSVPDLVVASTTGHSGAAYLLVGRYGSESYVELKQVALEGQGDADIANIVAVCDVTEQRELKRRLGYASTHDILTECFHRRELERRLEEVLLEKSSIRSWALILVDVDQLRSMNANHGYSAGDTYLRTLAAELRAELPSKHMFARLWGGTFGILVEDVTPDEANRLGNSLRNVPHSMNLAWGHSRLSISTVSVGIVHSDLSSSDTSAILRSAEQACQSAKHAGGNSVIVAVK